LKSLKGGGGGGDAALHLPRNTMHQWSHSGSYAPTLI